MPLFLINSTRASSRSEAQVNLTGIGILMVSSEKDFLLPKCCLNLGSKKRDTTPSLYRLYSCMIRFLGFTWIRYLGCSPTASKPACADFMNLPDGLIVM